ncbi:MAG: TIGR00730 family Rossman fold protein [Bacteroidota bacterium]
MKKTGKAVKAYNDLEFLNSKDARTLRILAEFLHPKARFDQNKIVDTIVFFGSARIVSRKDALKMLNDAKKDKSKTGNAKFEKALKALEMSQYYEDSVELGKRLTQWSMSLPTAGKRFMICSGGGPGIMEAANKGAYLADGHSIGLNISIPFEQFVNKYVDPNLTFEFHYFFMRKLWFMYLAKSLVAFPGGFGTLDEMMEVLTLAQTKKVTKPIKVVLFGESYWKEVINFDALIEHGMISKEDLKLFDFASTVEDAFNKITTYLIKHYLSPRKTKKRTKK